MKQHRQELPPIQFKALADALLPMAGTLVPDWLPGGRRNGREWTCGSLAGEAGSSCSVNLVTGKWADFASGEQGVDLLSLYAAIHNIEMHEAAVQLARAHGLESWLALQYAGESIEVALALPGEHNARNALGAAGVALAAGISLADVAAGLSAFKGVKGRLQRHAGFGGAVVLDDTYNANPDSVRAAIDVLAATVGNKVLVLGDMGEIGEMSAQFHDEVGGYAKSQGIDRLFAFGEASALAAHNFGEGGVHFAKLDELVEALKSEMRAGTTVLVKGSRFMRMERIVEAVVTDPAGGTH